MASKLGILSGRQSPLDAAKEELEKATNALAAARTNVAQIKEQHAPGLAKLIADDNQEALRARREELGAAEETVMLWQQRMDEWTAKVAHLESEKKAKDLADRWAATRKRMRDRAALIAKAQKLAIELAETNKAVMDLSAELWSGLPVSPGSPPLTFGKSFPIRVNLYLFMASEGLLGTGGVTVAIARKQPDLITLDSEVQGILLKPLAEAA